MKEKKSIFLQIQVEKICIPLMRDAQKLARTRSMLRPKIRAHARARGFNARTRSVLGILMLDPSLLS